MKKYTNPLLLSLLMLTAPLVPIPPLGLVGPPPPRAKMTAPPASIAVRDNVKRVAARVSKTLIRCAQAARANTPVA
jgi:hypothetical protein